MVAAGVGVVAAGGQRVLRRDDEPLALPLDELADDLLALAVRVVAGRVDEVAALADEHVEDAAALLLRGTPAPGFAEGHRPECDLGDPEAARAKQSVAHQCSSVPTIAATRSAIRVGASRRGTYV
jgi:hypothetical protein